MGRVDVGFEEGAVGGEEAGTGDGGNETEDVVFGDLGV